MNKRYSIATKIYQEIIEKYPGTPEAETAAVRLKAIRSEGE